MARLYADEDFSYPVVQRLRQLGHDICTAHEAGQADQGIKDEAVLAFAIATGRAVLTFNRRHFIRLHAEVLSHEGIIVCTRDDDVSALANRIHQQLQSVPTLQDQLLRINRPARLERVCRPCIASLRRAGFEYFDCTGCGQCWTGPSGSSGIFSEVEKQRFFSGRVMLAVGSSGQDSGDDAVLV